jgi:hypothetical protein
VTRRLHRLAAVALAAIALTASASCGGKAGSASSRSPLPSGSLGVVEPAAAETAVQGLCRIAADDPSDPGAASAEFFDHVHEELHVIAAAVQSQDTQVAARVLQAKEQVEADLEASSLPPSFPDDVRALLDATRSSLQTLGLEVPACS